MAYTSPGIELRCEPRRDVELLCYTSESAPPGALSPRISVFYFGQVGEWLKPTDCKSVPPCEVRRFESFPVHQSFEEFFERTAPDALDCF